MKKKKSSDKCQLRAILHNNLAALSKIVKTMKNKAWKKCHSQEEPKDKWWLNVLW